MIPELPFETWSSIFRIVVQNDDTTSSCVRLLKVNQRWRKIASDSPHLWTHLQIRNTNPSQAEFYVQHSKNLPIEVEIKLLSSRDGILLLNRGVLSSRNSLDLTPNIPSVDVDGLARVLSSHVGRMKALRVQVTDHECADKLIALIGRGQPAPILESLHLQVHGKPSSGASGASLGARGFPSLQSAFHSTPTLTHLGLPIHLLPPNISQIFSSSSLTSLTLIASEYSNRGLALTQITDIIQSVRNLRTLTFKSQRGYPFLVHWLPEVDTQLLEAVDVAVDGLSIRIIRSLRAPILSKVRLDGKTYQVEGDSSSSSSSRADTPGKQSITILRFLSSRSLPIKELTLCGIPLHCYEEECIWLFSDAFPMMEVLRFESTDNLDALFALTPPGGIPNLQALELYACKRINGHGFFEFLEKRVRGFRLEIEDCRNVTRKTLKTLAKLATGNNTGEDWESSSQSRRTFIIL